MTAIGRRGFLKGALLAAGAAALPTTAQATPAKHKPKPRAATDAQYPVNRAPLQPAAFLRLPPGAVTPAGWLATQLDYQLNGLNGRYQDDSHFLVFNSTGWVDPSQARLGGGAVLAARLRRPRLRHRRRDRAVQHRAVDQRRSWRPRQSDGFFGPTGPAHHHQRPRRPVAAHADDARAALLVGVPPTTRACTTFLTRVLRATSPRNPSTCSPTAGATTRWGDTIDVIYWLYNRTGNSHLLDLVTRIHANWRTGQAASPACTTSTSRRASASPPSTGRCPAHRPTTTRLPELRERCWAGTASSPAAVSRATRTRGPVSATRARVSRPAASSSSWPATRS